MKDSEDHNFGHLWFSLQIIETWELVNTASIPEGDINAHKISQFFISFEIFGFIQLRSTILFSLRPVSQLLINLQITQPGIIRLKSRFHNMTCPLFVKLSSGQFIILRLVLHDLFKLFQSHRNIFRNSIKLLNH